MSRTRLITAAAVRQGAGVLASVLALVALAGCGGEATGPPVDVLPVKGSPLAGIQDDTVFQLTEESAKRVRTMAVSGAAVTRVDMFWSRIAVSRPKDPTNPDDPAYDWTAYDRVVDLADQNGLEVLFSVYGTPTWAADPTVETPAVATLPEREMIRPRDPADYGAFATAAAKRYAPRGVKKWEAWNEPNIILFLHPQYERRANGWVAVSPQVYSELLKSFYAGIKSVDPTAVVAGGVTAPVGDPCADACTFAVREAEPRRIRVRDFLKALDQPGRRPPMDIVSHHPYPISGPRPSTRPTASFIDVYNLDALLTAIDRTYLRDSKIWLSEYGFPTAPVPQAPKHFTEAEQRDHIADAFQRIRAVPRVELAIYYLLHDHPGWKSGLFRQDGTPKPGLSAFSLPVVVSPAAAGKPVRLTGQVRTAVAATEARVEWKSGDTWRMLTLAKTAKDGSFSVDVRPEEATTIRVVWEGPTRSGERVTVTSPEVQVPAVAGS